MVVLDLSVSSDPSELTITYELGNAVTFTLSVGDHQR